MLDDDDLRWEVRTFLFDIAQKHDLFNECDEPEPGTLNALVERTIGREEGFELYVTDAGRDADGDCPHIGIVFNDGKYIGTGLNETEEAAVIRDAFDALPDGKGDFEATLHEAIERAWA